MPQFDRSMVSTSKLLSFDVDGDHYYGGSSAAAVPFNWESQPGTPRRTSSSGFDFGSLVSAPLTPPPSYFYASLSSTKTVNPKNNTHFGSFRHKNRSTPSSPAASSSSSSSSSASSPLRRTVRNTRRSTWFGSLGCYASIVKVFLRDVK